MPSSVTPQGRHSYPAFRVFIFGAEVTELVSTVSYSWTDQRAPSTCEMTLANEHDCLVVTHEDIGTLREITDAVLNTAEVDDSTSRRLKDFDPLQTKRKVLLEKVKYTEEIPPGTSDIKNILGSLNNNASKSEVGQTPGIRCMNGHAVRYPLQVGQCIFHSNDPVRIFMRDIFNPLEWYFAFTGYITDWSESCDPTGKKVVRIVCEDVLRNLRHSQLTTNFAFGDIAAIADAQRDEAMRSWFVNSLVGLNLLEVVYTMIFGTERSGLKASALKEIPATAGKKKGFSPSRPIDNRRVGIHGSVPYRADEQGAGSFNYADSQVFTYGDPQPDDLKVVGKKEILNLNENRGGLEPLEYYQYSLDTRIDLLPSTIQETLRSLADINDAGSSSFMTAEEQSSLNGEIAGLTAQAGLAKTQGQKLQVLEDFITLVGEHPEWFPVDKGRVFMLLPSGVGTGLTNSLLTKDLLNGVSTKTQFLKRLQILYNHVEKIDFSLYATPRGDVVIEMPLYDFEPRDFGSFADRYTYKMTDTIRWETAFSDEHIRTQYNTTYNVSSAYSLATSDQLWQSPGVVRLNALVPLFGVRSEYIDSQTYLTNQSAAAYYGMVKLNQFNANAWNSRIDTVFRLGVGPNRPCYFEARDFISTVRRSGGNLSWGVSGGVSSTLEVNYRRGWSGLTREVGSGTAAITIPAYETFGGFASRPLNYAELFRADYERPQTSTNVSDAKGQAIAARLAPSVKSKWNDRVKKWAGDVGLGNDQQFVNLVLAAMTVESAGNEAAVGDGGKALGLFQLNNANASALGSQYLQAQGKSWAGSYGKDDPRFNVELSGSYMVSKFAGAYMAAGGFTNANLPTSTIQTIIVSVEHPAKSSEGRYGAAYDRLKAQGESK